MSDSAMSDSAMSEGKHPGTAGVVEVYTKYMHHIALIRKVLLRMGAWKNHIFSDGH